MATMLDREQRGIEFSSERSLLRIRATVTASMSVSEMLVFHFVQPGPVRFCCSLLLLRGWG